MAFRLIATGVTYGVALGLIVFSVRRVVFSATALIGSLLEQPGHASAPAARTNKRFDAPVDLPTVALLLPARDEELSIAQTLEAIARLDYPRDSLRVVMVDDCSNDRTPLIMQSYAQAHPNFTYHRTSSRRSLGKAAALNDALQAVKEGEIVYVLDADSTPDAACVRAAVQHFADDRVGAVTGAPFPSRDCSSFASYYAYLETLVHRSVTTRAKDILGLAPPIFGSNCAYRRSAIERVGGLRNGALLEDSDLVLALYSEGYAVHFEPRAVSHLAMPRTVSSYVRQHARWTRGFNDVLGGRARDVISRKHLPLILRVELCLFASGYLDRVLTIAGLGLAASDVLHGQPFRFPRWVLAVSFLSPLLTIVSALLICREPLTRHWRLPLVPLFFAVDVVSTLSGMLDSAVGRPRTWQKVDREPL